MSSDGWEPIGVGLIERKAGKFRVKYRCTECEKITVGSKERKDMHFPFCELREPAGDRAVLLRRGEEKLKKISNEKQIDKWSKAKARRKRNRAGKSSS